MARKRGGLPGSGVLIARSWLAMRIALASDPAVLALKRGLSAWLGEPLDRFELSSPP